MPHIEFKRTMFEEIREDTKTFETGNLEGLFILKRAYTAYEKSGDLTDFVQIALGAHRVESKVQPMHCRQCKRITKHGTPFFGYPFMCRDPDHKT
jgi:hypothetical protein